MEYLGRVNVSAVVSPSRAAYLIRPQSKEGFRAAAQEASSRWGGQCELIVPVYAGRGLDAGWRQMIEVSGVDGLVNVDVPEAHAQKVGRQLGLTVVPLNQIDHWGETKWTMHPAIVDSWANEANHPVAASPGASIWEVAAVGGATAEGGNILQEQGLALRCPSAPDQIARAQLSRSSLIHRTTRHFYEYSSTDGPFGFSTLLWVVKPDSLLDCLSFWNYRAMAPINEPAGQVFILPVDQVQHWLHFNEQLHQQLVRPDEFDPDVILLSYSVPNEAMHATASTLGLTVATKGLRASRRFGAENRTAPFTYLVDKDPRQFLLFGRRYGLQMQAEAFREEPKTVVVLDSPISFTGSGYVKLAMRSPAFSGIPQRTHTAEMLTNNGIWRDGALEIKTHGYSRYQLDLTLPALRENAEAVLDRAVAGWQVSEKGRLALPLMTQAILSACRQPEAPDILAALTTPRSKELERQLRELQASGESDTALLELAARWGGRSERRFRRATDLPSKKALPIIESWCQLGLVERGLGISCAGCGVPTFVPLQQERSEAVCPGCGNAGTYDTSGKNLAVYYRLSTFLDRASDQGTIPVLTTIATLFQRSEHTFVIPGVNLTLHDGRKSEVDIFGIHDGQVIAGEIKTSASQFTSNQLMRDVELSRELTADTHVIASLDPLPARVLSETQHLCDKAGIKLISVCGHKPV